MSWGRSCQIWGPQKAVVSMPWVVVNCRLETRDLGFFRVIIFITGGERSFKNL